jgi:hypothetical protein
VLQQRQRRAEVAEHEGKRRTRNDSVWGSDPEHERRWGREPREGGEGFLESSSPATEGDEARQILMASGDGLKLGRQRRMTGWP